MGDRSHASLTIGGHIPITCLPDLLAAIASDHAVLDASDEPVEEEHFVVGKLVRLNIAETIAGRAAHIEDCCKKYGIAFVRRSGSCSGMFGAERAVFRGSGQPRHCVESEQGEVLLSQSDLAGLRSLEAVRSWFAGADYSPPPITFDVAMVSSGPATEVRRV